VLIVAWFRLFFNFSICWILFISVDMLSGRYWANVSDTLLSGEFHQWKDGELTAIVHKPGLFLSVLIDYSWSVFSKCGICVTLSKHFGARSGIFRGRSVKNLQNLCVLQQFLAILLTFSYSDSVSPVHNFTCTTWNIVLLTVLYKLSTY